MLLSVNNRRLLPLAAFTKPLLLAILFSLAGVAAIQGLENRYIIRGVIKSGDGRPSVGAIVELKRIVMSNNPTIDTVDKTLTDAQGRFLFMLTGVEPKKFFRIDVKAGSISIGSDPLKFRNAQTEIVADFTLPEISRRTENLKVEKNIYVFDLLESGVQVTEIINLTNESGQVLDTRQAVLEKSIPEIATDFYFLKKNKDFNVYFDSGKVVFQLVVPPGQHQLYFSYNLPASGNSTLFEGGLLPNTSDVELIVPDNGPTVSFLFKDSNRGRGVVRKDQYYGNRLYHSQSLSTEKHMVQLSVKINGIPVSSMGFIYPAGVLAILLLLGLFWFLLSRNRPQAHI